MPAAYRCPPARCGIDWPLEPEKYKVCPSCLERCIPVGIGKPLEEKVAHSMMCWMEYERVCAKRDAAREAERAERDAEAERVIERLQLEEPGPRKVA